jgi:hypothetical protein
VLVLFSGGSSGVSAVKSRLPGSGSAAYGSLAAQKAAFLAADASWVDRSQSGFPCPEEYIDVINDVVRPEGRTPAHVPVLNIEQITWISTIVRSAAEARQGLAHNFLVHGLGRLLETDFQMRPSARTGFDSLIWRSANCLASNTRSRTLFTENWESWIVDVKKDLPFVDVQFVQYNTTGGEAEQDLADPSRMDPVPDSIAVRGVADKPLDADRCAGTLLGRDAC